VVIVSNPLGIKIIGAFDFKITEAKLKAQLAAIEKKLSVQIGIDAKQIGQISKQIQQMQGQLKKQGNGIKIIDDKDAIKNIDKVNKGTRELWTSAEKAVNEYRKLGTVKFNKSFDPVTKEVQGFNLQLKRADDTLENLKFKLANIQTPKGLSTAFELEKRNVVDNSDKIKESQLQKQHAIKRQITIEEEKQIKKQDEEKKKLNEQNQQLEHQIRMYKQRAQIQAQNLTRRYGDQVDSAGMNRYLAQVNSLNANTPRVRQQMDELNLSFQRLGSSVNTSSSHVLGFGEQLGVAMQRFPIWMIASTAFYQSLNILTSFYDTLTLIDEKLISIAKVTNSTDMAGMLDRATESAKEFGRTIDQALTSVGEISKLGFNKEQAESLSRDSLLLATVGEMGDADAANYLVGILRQYKLEVADVSSVVDSLNELSNKTGATTISLGQALSKSSSSAQVAGMSFNELAGVASTVIETLKIGGNEAGTFLKTLNTRILRETTQKDLESFGIQVKNTNGELLSSTQILNNVSNAWDGFDKTTKNAIGESLGGAWHTNKVVATIEGMDRAMENAEVSANSYGSATRELATFQEGLAFKTANLKASLQELAMTAAGSGGRSGLVVLIETTTMMIEGFNRLTEATDGWNIKLPLLAAGVFGVTKAIHALSLAATGAKLSFGWIGLGVIALEGIISALSGATMANEINTDSLIENSKQSAVNANNLKSLFDQYNRLKDGAGQNAEKHAELQVVLEKIREIAPSLVKHNDDYTLSLDANAKKVDEYASSLKLLSDEQLKQAQLANSLNLSNTKTELSSLNQEIQDFEKQNKKSLDAILNYESQNKVGSIVEAKKQLDEATVKLQKEYDNGVKKQASQDELQRINDEIANLTSNYAKYADAKGKADGTLGDYAKKVEERNNLIAEADGYKQQAEAMNSLSKDSDKLGQSNENLSQSMDKAKSSAAGLDEVNQELGMGMDGTGSGVSDLVSKLDDAVSKIESLNGIINELNDEDGHGVSADSISLMLEKYPDLLAYLDDEVTLRSKISEEIEKENNIAIDVATEKLKNSETYFQKVKDGNSELVKTLADVYEVDLANSKTLAQFKLAVEQGLIQKLGEGWADYYDVQAQAFTESGRKMLEHMSIGAAAANPQLKAISEYEASMKGLTDSLRGFTIESGFGNLAMSGLSDASKGASKEYENATYVTDKFKTALESVSFELEKQRKIQAQFPKHSKQYQSALKNEISLLDQKKKLLEGQTKALDAQIKSGKIAQTGIVTSKSPTSSSSYSSGGSYSGKYSDIINKAAAMYGIDANLIAAIVKAESNFNPNARSHAGAMGLMQLMPGTASGLGVKNAYDPSQNIMGGAKYIAQQLKAFGGDIEKALVAYNAGAGNVTKYGGIPPFAETQKYVPKVLGYYQQFGNGASSSGASKEVAENLQSIDEAKSELLQLQQDTMSVSEEMQRLQLELIKTPLYQAENRFRQIDSQMKIYDARIDKQDELSKEYRVNLQNQIVLLKEKKKLTEQNMVYIERELKTNKSLTQLQRDELQQTYLDLRDGLIDIDNSIVGFLNQHLNSALDSLNKRFDDSFKKINDELELLEHNMQMIDESDERQLTLMDMKVDSLNKQRVEIENNIKLLQSQTKNLQNNHAALEKNTQEIEKWEDALREVDLQIVQTQKDLQSKMTEIFQEQRDAYFDGIKKDYDTQRKYLEKQIEDAEDYYEPLIEAKQEQLKLLDEEYEKEDRLKNLREINDDINKTKNDKRFSYINEQGEEILTYDKARVSELEKQRDELLQQYQREDIKKAIQDDIDLLEKAKNDRLDILRKQLDDLQVNYDLQVEQNEKLWDDMLKSAEEGTLNFDELMNGWYGTSLTALAQYGVDIASEVDKIKAIIASLAGLKVPDVKMPSSGGGTGTTTTKTFSSAEEERAYRANNPNDPYTVAKDTRHIDYLEEKGVENWTAADKADYEKLIERQKKHDGGIVGDVKGGKLAQIFNKVFNLKPGESAVKSLVGELQIPPKNFANGMMNIQNAINSIVPRQTLQPVGDTILLQGVTIKADNPKQFFNDLDIYIRMNK
jgi:TP901 family phage tail tape measure protein